MWWRRDAFESKMFIDLCAGYRRKLLKENDFFYCYSGLNDLSSFPIVCWCHVTDLTYDATQISTDFERAHWLPSVKRHMLSFPKFQTELINPLICWTVFHLTAQLMSMKFTNLHRDGVIAFSADVSRIVMTGSFVRRLQSYNGLSEYLLEHNKRSVFINGNFLSALPWGWVHRKQLLNHFFCKGVRAFENYKTWYQEVNF